MTLLEIQKTSHSIAVEKGWYEQDRGVPELLCLIHSEISEVLEAYRDHGVKGWLGENGKPEGVGAELADAIIRICDMAEYFGIDLENWVVAKTAYNRTRPHRHGGKLA